MKRCQSLSRREIRKGVLAPLLTQWAIELRILAPWWQHISTSSVRRCNGFGWAAKHSQTSSWLPRITLINCDKLFVWFPMPFDSWIIQASTKPQSGYSAFSTQSDSLTLQQGDWIYGLKDTESTSKPEALRSVEYRRSVYMNIYNTL